MILHEGKVVVLDEWHKWFPLIPVFTNRWRWLRTVERRAYDCCIGGDKWWDWEYRDLDEQQ